MDNITLFEILTTRTKEELNDSINRIGKKKLVNAIAFIDKKESLEKGEKENE
nr:MAG TPA: hypothetical protein [Caudoviricetes sp.]